MTEQASCEHCGKKWARRNLKPSPNGGALCKDWFGCQQRVDARRAERAGSHGLRRAS